MHRFVCVCMRCSLCQTCLFHINGFVCLWPFFFFFFFSVCGGKRIRNPNWGRVEDLHMRSSFKRMYGVKGIHRHHHGYHHQIERQQQHHHHAEIVCTQANRQTIRHPQTTIRRSAWESKKERTRKKWLVSRVVSEYIKSGVHVFMIYISHLLGLSSVLWLVVCYSSMYTYFRNDISEFRQFFCECVSNQSALHSRKWRTYIV